MKYHTKIFQNIKFPSLIILQALNNFVDKYKNTQLVLHISSTKNNIYSYDNWNSFIKDYDQNHTITASIEYVVSNISHIKIEYTKPHTNIYMLHNSNYDFNTLINSLEKYIQLNNHL